MKCDSKQMAYRVATVGAKKMGAEYRFERLDVWNWWVSSPTGGYNVAIFDSGEAHCGCAFYSENAEYGVCKHTQKLRWLTSAEAEREEQQAYEDRIALEAEVRMGAECPKYGRVATP